jgi:hypothetical protein
MKVILEKYPASKAADAQRLFYADALLIPNSRWAETVEVLKDVPAGHKDYFLSQRLLVVALYQVFRAMPAEAGADREAAAQRAIAEADRIMLEGERGMQQGDEDAKQAAGWARLVRADLAIEYENDIEKALALLRDFDVTFTGDDDLIREMLQKRIVGNLKVEKLKEAVAEARRMMGSFPNQAAAVISRVLDELKLQMDALTARMGAELVAARKAQLQQQLTTRADAAVQLAGMLNDWAAAQKFSAEELVPFKLIFIQALRLNGDFKDAVAIAEPLAAQFPKDATVLFNLAESLFELGRRADPPDEKMLVRADGLYKQVIEGLRPEKGTGKYPTIWWNSWLRWLQIRDILNLNQQDIPTTIRNLRSRDPGLGGEQFKKDFESLEVKHGV